MCWVLMDKIMWSFFYGDVIRAVHGEGLLSDTADKNL